MSKENGETRYRVRSSRAAAAVRAREKAAAFAHREQELLDLATRFFALEGASEAAKILRRLEVYQQKIAELEKELKPAQQQLEAEQASVIADMRRVGERPDAIAQRLGLPVAKVRKILKEKSK